MNSLSHGLRPSRLALLLVATAICGLAQAALPVSNGTLVQPLAEHIMLDNSDEGELVISNTDTPDSANEPVVQSSLRHTSKFNQSRWKSGAVPYQAEVQAAAEATLIDPALIHAVIATESGYNPRALSPKGAYGLMQVLPATAQTMTTVPVRQWSVPQQILWGSHYLKRMLDMFEGNVTLALAAYNAGPQAVKTHQHAVPPFAETRQYVPKVLGYYQAFKTRLAPSSYASPINN